MRSIRIITVITAILAVIALALTFYGLSLGIVSVIFSVFKHFDRTGDFTMTGAIIIYAFLIGAVAICVYFKRKEDAEEKAYLRRRIRDERFLIRHECPTNNDLLREMDQLKQVLRCMDSGDEDTIEYCEKYERLYCRLCAVEEEIQYRGC